MKIFINRKRLIGFCFLGIGSTLSFFISCLWLILRLQKDLEVTIIEPPVARFLWIVQAFAEYASIGFFVAGVVMLLKEFRWTNSKDVLDE